MKRSLIILALLFFLFITCKKDADRNEPPPYGPPTAIEWTAITGEPGRPGQSLLFTSDQNIIVSGSRDSNALIFKADTACKILWEICAGSGITERALMTLETPDQNYVSLISANEGSHPSGDSYWLYYINFSGTISDSFAIDPSVMNYVADMAIAHDGGVLITGFRIQDGMDQPHSDHWTVMKVMKEGGSSWKRSYEESEELELIDLAVDPAGIIHLSATLASDDRYFILYQLKSNGKILSREEIFNDYNAAITFTENCSTLLCGYIPFEPDGNAYLRSLDIHGNLLWDHTYEVNPWDSSYNPLRHIVPMENGFIAFGSAIYLNSLVNAMSDMTAWISVFDGTEHLEWHTVWTPGDADRPCNFLIHSVEYVGDEKCILLGEGILDYPCAEAGEIFIIPVNSQGFIYPTSPEK